MTLSDYILSGSPLAPNSVVLQWSGKEIRNLGKVILGIFTAEVRWIADQPRPTGAQVQEFNKAIRCVRSITDFYLMTQYDSHTDQTMSYMQEYLRTFHETKYVFLRFRAGKKAKRAATEAYKNLLQDQKGGMASVNNLSASEKAKWRQENTLERRELVDEILKEEAHYNFPKIHLISHYAEQIPKFGALGQYSTEISETMHKGLKDAYRRSNRVNATAQIVTTYTRDHTFAMKDLTIKAWKQTRAGGEPTGGVGQLYFKLREKIKLGIVGNLVDLESATALGDLALATRVFLMRDVRCTNSDVRRLLEGDIRAYKALEIPVPKLSGKGFVVHHARCTGLTMFRGQRRSDWVWVRRHPGSDMARSGSLNGRMPGRLNALFKFKSKEGVVYRVANVSLLQCIGGNTVQGAEGMLPVGWGGNEESVVVRIAKIEGMAHLIPLDRGVSWELNNRIDI